MLIAILLLIFLAVFFLILAFVPFGKWDSRPRLQPLEGELFVRPRQKPARGIIRTVALINRPICRGQLGERIAKDLSVGHVAMIPEEFFLIKEITLVAALFAVSTFTDPQMRFFWICMAFVFGYMAPELWLKGKIARVKSTLVRELPDAIDLLGLCVNAGLDFMLALKWVIDKSRPSVMIDELRNIMQEINIGKTRRDALRDLARKYEIPDLSSLSRTLIQADKMGTSVADALNILSEDMRASRFRRGEQMALKAPMKMLVPLLFFIFPVVAILVAGPIFIDFMENNPMRQLGATTSQSAPAPR